MVIFTHFCKIKHLSYLLIMKKRFKEEMSLIIEWGIENL